ncbi:MAG: hypothetical protein QOD74_2323, partial [Variibacter sp.]|nr:hypothetical protein [Variibacter sp.]
TFWCVMIVFSLITTKILHYVSLAYFPLAYFAALALERTRLGVGQGWVYRSALIALGAIWFVVTTAGPVAILFRERWASLLPRPFDRANVLAPANWTILDIAPGLLFGAALLLAVHLFKKDRAFTAHLAIFAGTGALIALALPLLGGKIHAHTQGALVGFLRTATAEHALGRTTFKSYVQDFYSDLSLVAAPAQATSHYLIGRLGDTPGPEWSRVREENGYVLFKASPAPHPAAAPPDGH